VIWPKSRSFFSFLVSDFSRTFIIYEEFTEEGQRLEKERKGRKIQSEIASGTEGLRRSSLVRVFGLGDRDGRKSVSLARWLAGSLAGVISLGLALRG